MLHLSFLHGLHSLDCRLEDLFELFLAEMGLVDFPVGQVFSERLVGVFPEGIDLIEIRAHGIFSLLLKVYIGKIVPLRRVRKLLLRFFLFFIFSVVMENSLNSLIVNSLSRHSWSVFR